MPDDVRTALEQAAQDPVRVEGDEGTVVAHPLGDVIAADRYLSAKTAVDASKSRGLRFMKISPPGAQ